MSEASEGSEKTGDRRIDLAGFRPVGFERGASRFKEMLWWLVRGVFFQCWFPWPSSVKRSLLRWFGARVGQGVVIRPRVTITFPWRLEMGDHVWLGEEVLLLSLAPVTIGSHVCISQRAFLCTGSHDFDAPGFDLITGPVVIGSHSWVAAGVFVGPGVHVGEGSLLAAGTVVVRDVPPDSFVIGNPAMVMPRKGDDS